MPTPASSGLLTQVHSISQGPQNQLQWYLPSAPGLPLTPTFSAPWQGPSLCSPHTCILLGCCSQCRFQDKSSPWKWTPVKTHPCLLLSSQHRPGILEHSLVSHNLVQCLSSMPEKRRSFVFGVDTPVYPAMTVWPWCPTDTCWLSRWTTEQMNHELLTP